MSAGLAPNNQSKYGGQHALIVDRERSADSTYYDAEPSRLFMMRLYAWTKDEDDVALDAITVGIRSDTRILTVAGLQFGQRDAVIYWPEWAGKGDGIPAAMEGPMPVQSALERAERLCALHAFERVVLWLQHRELWDERWGKLAPVQGL